VVSQTEPKEQSDPIFRFWTEGDWWGFPFFSLSASRYFGDKKTLFLYWPLGTVVITGPKVADFYAGFCAHRATSLKSDGKDILSVTMVLNSEHSREDPVIKSYSSYVKVAPRAPPKT
jgi:hypothetical protein